MARFRITLLMCFIFIVALHLSADHGVFSGFDPTSFAASKLEDSRPVGFQEKARFPSQGRLSAKKGNAEGSDTGTLRVVPERDERHLVVDPLRGIYLSGWAAGVRLTETIHYMREHDLNTIVVDIKDTDGCLSFALPGTMADALGANASKMGSPQRVRQKLDELRQEGIYVIGRLALFQDNFLAQRRPEWALQTPTGQLWQDASGNYWLDPAQPELLDYHVEIAVAAAKLGFDEIQFDYLRYPGQRVPGYNDGAKEQRTAVITQFAALARRRIQEQVELRVSAAIYGIIAVSELDHHLGQDLVALTHALDYVSPMFYPSHYLPGDFSLSDPNAEPYKTLFASTAAALARTSDADWPKLRPWIQSFFGYDKAQVEDQIRALKDLGVDSFLVWNPSGRYVSGVDYHLLAEGEGALANSPFRKVLYPLMSPAAGVFVADPALKFPTRFEDKSDDSASTDWEVRANRQPGGYRVELWRGGSAASPAEARGGERIIAVQRTAKAPREVSGDHGEENVVQQVNNVATIVPDEDGVALTWEEQGYEWRLWAPSFREALEAKRSLRAVPSALF